MTHSVRTDAEAFYVFDVSRSMLAASSAGAHAPHRACGGSRGEVHGPLAKLPSGVASLTDRVLPHLFPTGGRGGLHRHPRARAHHRPSAAPGLRPGGERSSRRSIRSPATPSSARASKHRVVIVLTDGESRPYDVADLRQTLASGPPLDFIVVRIWTSPDRVWNGDTQVADYRADPSSERRTGQLASRPAPRSSRQVTQTASSAPCGSSVGSGPEVEGGRLLRVVGARTVVRARGARSRSDLSSGGGISGNGGPTCARRIAAEKADA